MSDAVFWGGLSNTEGAHVLPDKYAGMSLRCGAASAGCELTLLRFFSMRHRDCIRTNSHRRRRGVLQAVESDLYRIKELEGDLRTADERPEQ